MSDKPKAPEIELLCDLIQRQSVTPEDAGCQSVLIERLEACGFDCETMVFGEVTNLWARRGSGSPVLCFAGHTDVVPPGDLSEWDSAPFVATFKDGLIYGRGSADMKSGLASMLVAIEQFLVDNNDHKGSLALLITRDLVVRSLDCTL